MWALPPTRMWFTKIPALIAVSSYLSSTSLPDPQWFNPTYFLSDPSEMRPKCASREAPLTLGKLLFYFPAGETVG